MRLSSVVLAVLLLLPRLAPAAPDEDALGKREGYPRGTMATAFEERFRVGAFSAIDRLFPARTVRKGSRTLPLKRAAAEPAIAYQLDGQTYSLDDYLARQRITGLLVIKDGEILVERYQYGRQQTDRMLSNSMAKSVASLALGIALGQGKIASLDDKAAKYVPRLSGCAYGETALRHLLRMSSGVRFVEDYSGQDDLARFSRTLNAQDMPAALRLFSDHDAAPGERFHYASSETAVLGLVLRAATGQSLADYVSAQLWQPLGAEADASWVTDPHGVERAYGYFNAVLRDYGRLGWLLAHDGELAGRTIVPRDYVLAATDWHRQPPAFAPGKASPYYGYGYQFWLFPGQQRRFALLGVYGQAVFVDPQLKLVMVNTAVAHDATDKGLGRERDALWWGLVRHFGSW